MLGTARDEFFGLFKDEIDRTLDEILMAGQNFGDRCEDSCMGVVAAGMHDAGIRALIRQVVFFQETEGIEVGTQADGRSRLRTLENANRAVARNAWQQIDTCGGQMFPDPFGCVCFLER